MTDPFLVNQTLADSMRTLSDELLVLMIEQSLRWHDSVSLIHAIREQSRRELIETEYSEDVPYVDDMDEVPYADLVPYHTLAVRLYSEEEY